MRREMKKRNVKVFIFGNAKKKDLACATCGFRWLMVVAVSH